MERCRSPALGHTTSFQYDTHGSLSEILDPLGRTQQFAANAQGRPTSVTDSVGDTTTLAYASGDLASVTDPLGNVTSLFTDQLGRLIATTDPQGRVRRYRPDNLNQITGITDPLGNTISLSYDPNGNLLAMTDALHVTTYSYDNMDRLSTRTDALHRQESCTYDVGGYLATFTDRKGQVSGSTFDGLKRLTSSAFGVQSGSSGTTSQSNISYSHDAGVAMLGAKQMNREGWLWSMRALERFALLGTPAVATLMFWRRRGVESRTIYHVSWANPLAYIIWLVAMAVVATFSHFREFTWMVFSFIPAGLAFFCPLLMSVGSLILCFLSGGSKQVERPFIVLSNLLMLILWIWSVAAPN